MTQANHKDMARRRPSALLSVLPIVLLVVLLTATIQSFGSDALGGASQVTLLIVSAFCVFVGMVFLHVPCLAFEKAIT